MGQAWNTTEIKNLRNEAGLPNNINLKRISDLVDHCNSDMDLTLTALTMVPRPTWVCIMLGLHPQSKV